MKTVNRLVAENLSDKEFLSATSIIDRIIGAENLPVGSPIIPSKKQVNRALSKFYCNGFLNREIYTTTKKGKSYKMYVYNIGPVHKTKLINSISDFSRRVRSNISHQKSRKSSSVTPTVAKTIKENIEPNRWFTALEAKSIVEKIKGRRVSPQTVRTGLRRFDDPDLKLITENKHNLTEQELDEIKHSYKCSTVFKFVKRFEETEEIPESEYDHGIPVISQPEPEKSVKVEQDSMQSLMEKLNRVKVDITEIEQELNKFKDQFELLDKVQQLINR